MIYHIWSVNCPVWWTIRECQRYMRRRLKPASRFGRDSILRAERRKMYSDVAGFQREHQAIVREFRL